MKPSSLNASSVTSRYASSGAFPGGRWQTAEATWDPHAKSGSNVYGADDRQPGGGALDRAQDELEYHVRHLPQHPARKNYDTTNDVSTPRWSSAASVARSCHGPMKAHNEWQYAKPGKTAKTPRSTNSSAIRCSPLAPHVIRVGAKSP